MTMTINEIKNEVEYVSDIDTIHMKNGMPAYRGVYI